MTKRVWKPLDVGGHRLYEVKMMFPECPQNNVSFVVVADSPTQARKMIEEIDRDSIHSSEPFYLGMPLNILMPADWLKRGVPCIHEKMRTKSETHEPPERIK